MKRLILMRHAKADDHFLGTDLLRPLTEEGRVIQTRMAHYMKSKGLKIDAILYSPYIRTQESAQIIGDVFDPVELIKERSLGISFDSYTILNHLKSLGGENLLLIGHEPTLALFATSLLKVPKVAHFDKSSYMIIDFENNYEFGQGQFVTMMTAAQVHDLLN